MRKLFYLLIVLFFHIIPTQVIAADKSAGEEGMVGNDDSYMYLKNSEMSGAHTDPFNFEVFERVELLKIALPSCADNPPDLEKCTPYICKIESKLGDIYTKVKGMKDGSCQYIERNIGIEGVNCQFKEGELPKLQKLFAKRFLRLAGNLVVVTEDDYADLASIFKTQCTLIPDFGSNKPISFTKSNNDEIDPEFGAFDLSKYSVAARPTPKKYVENALNPASEGYMANLTNYRSIMLLPRDTSTVKK